MTPDDQKHRRTPWRSIAAMTVMGVAGPIFMAGCNPHVAIEGGEKPIKIDVTVTLKVDRELDQFYSFEKKYEQPATQSTTQPTTQPAKTSE